MNNNYSKLYVLWAGFKIYPFLKNNCLAIRIAHDQIFSIDVMRLWSFDFNTFWLNVPKVGFFESLFIYQDKDKIF